MTVQNLYTAPICSAPQEYVADTHNVSTFPRGICPDQHTAQKNITAYLHERTAAVLYRDTRRPAVMLSGGIDSILVAAVLAQHRPDAVAVTVDFPVYSGAGDTPGGTGAGDTDDHATESTEVTTARAVAEALGLEHHVVSLGQYEITQAAQWVTDRLGTADVWEVLAAMVLRVADVRARREGAEGVLLTGAGADALFLGGQGRSGQGHGGHSHDAASWHEQVVTNVGRQFTYDRAIPEFYDLILNDPDRHIQMWQTVAATQLALALTPEQVRGGGGGVSDADPSVDKLILRQVAQDHGVPAMLTTAVKSPMQVSSGGVAGLVRAARAELAADRSHTHYADPITEPLEHTVARLWLNNIRMARHAR